MIQSSYLFWLRGLSQITFAFFGIFWPLTSLVCTFYVVSYTFLWPPKYPPQCKRNLWKLPKYHSVKHLFADLLLSIWSLSKTVSLFQKTMEVAFGKRFLKRFFSIVIFLGCAIFVAYRQRLSKIGFEILDSISIFFE